MSNDNLSSSSAYNTFLQLSWLIVKDLDAICHLANKLYKILMCRVLVDIVIAILLILEFYNESMG